MSRQDFLRRSRFRSQRGNHFLRDLAEDNELLEVGRKAVEDMLISLRDGRTSMINEPNGLVVREKDGQESSAIRLGIADALRIAFTAVADELDAEFQRRNRK